MFNEEKVRKDLERMREAYKKALKKLEDIKARQKKIAEEIYRAQAQAESKN